MVAILSILVSIGSASYRNYIKSVELDGVTKGIIFDLRQARAKAMSGEERSRWGVHLVNGTDDYYELFLTESDYASATVTATTFLSGGIAFSTPGEGVTKDVVFFKISGTTTSETVGLTFEGETRTITVTSEGVVY